MTNNSNKIIIIKLLRMDIIRIRTIFAPAPDLVRVRTTCSPQQVACHLFKF